MNIRSTALKLFWVRHLSVIRYKFCKKSCVKNSITTFMKKSRLVSASTERRGRGGTEPPPRGCGELAECLRWRRYSRSLAATRRARYAPGVSVECSGAEAHTFDNIKQKNWPPNGSVRREGGDALGKILILFSWQTFFKFYDETFSLSIYNTNEI